LKQNSTLQEIGLGYNQIGDEGASAIAKALITNATIQKINLYGNKIGDEGASVIFEALKKSSPLCL
jgi:Ran GTPase-activating protein (RanGAP) involved in mRNA processing and transport